MVDDDVSTLLKLDEKGFHVGGTVQAGARPLFVASGGFTVNPPDLTGTGDKLRSLLTSARDTVQEAAHDLPDPSPTVGDAIEALRTAVADLRSDLPDLPSTPDLRADARDLTLRARQAVGLAPRRRSLLQQVPRWLPGGLLVIASIAVVGAVIALWEPRHGAERRRRLRDWFDGLRGREHPDLADEDDQPSATAPLAFRAIPVERDAGTPVVGVQLRD